MYMVRQYDNVMGGLEVMWLAAEINMTGFGQTLQYHVGSNIGGILSTLGGTQVICSRVAVVILA